MDYTRCTKKELVDMLMARERTDCKQCFVGVVDVLREFQYKKQEHFIVLCMDGSMHLIKKHVVFIGTVGNTLVHAREVFSPAIVDGASSIIIAHNHPSGSMQFSEEDIIMADKMYQAGNLIGIRVIDSAIVGLGRCESMRYREMAPFDKPIEEEKKYNTK